MNNPIVPLSEILFGDTQWLLPIRGHDEGNLVSLFAASCIFNFLRSRPKLSETRPRQRMSTILKL
jgi:hypothetical protein